MHVKFRGEYRIPPSIQNLDIPATNSRLRYKHESWLTTMCQCKIRVWYSTTGPVKRNESHVNVGWELLIWIYDPTFITSNMKLYYNEKRRVSVSMSVSVTLPKYLKYAFVRLIKANCLSGRFEVAGVDPRDFGSRVPCFFFHGQKSLSCPRAQTQRLSWTCCRFNEPLPSCIIVLTGLHLYSCASWFPTTPG